MDTDSKSTSSNLTNGVKEGHPVVTDQLESLSVAMDMVDTVTDTEFDQLCTRLNLPDDVKKKSWSVYTQMKCKDDEELKQIPKTELIVSAVYIAVVDTRMPYGPADPQLECGYLGQAVATVTDLLTYSQMRCTTLSQCLHVVESVISLSEAVKYHLKFLEKKYCIMSALYHTFERLCKVVFREEQKDDSSIPVPQTEDVEHRKTLCWVLFLHAKDCLSVDSQIVDGFYILVCCLEYVLRTTPAFQLNSSFAAVKINSIQSVNNEVQGLNSNLLKKLSEDLNCNYEEVSAVQSSRTESFIKSLKHTEGELDLENLKTLYEANYKHEGDLNEMLFLSCDTHLQPPENNTPMFKQSSTTTTSCDPPLTPLRAALNTIQQLKNMLTSASDEPSSALKEFFDKCSKNPTTSIASRLTRLKSVFIKEYVSETGENQRTTADQRFLLAQRLYYRVMEAMLNVEKERISQTDFSQLLNIDTFHVSLMACSMEIVLMTYDVSWNPSKGEMGSGDSRLSFPWILKVFLLHAYDFFKVLASFIKAEPVLTKDIVKHLQSLEIKILEELAWKADSPLFDVISNSEICHPNVTSPPDSNNGISASSAELYLSPVNPQRSRVISPSSSSTLSRKVAGGGPSPDKKLTPHKSQSLTIFLNKVCRLGYHRLQQLCSLLNVQKDMQHKIWTCLECCITHRPALLKNRHLDQIMMCSLYSICKVMDKEIKFKAIVQMYRELPNAEQHIYKSALIQGAEHDSIIAFYNKVFMQNMKTYITMFAPTKQTPTLSPVPKPVSSPLTSPVYRIAHRNHLYVSPLKDSPFKAPHSPSQMTPTTRQLYCFGEGIGSAEKLRNINETVFRAKNGSKSVTPKSLKRLKFDQPDDSIHNSADVFPDNCTIIVKKRKVSPQSQQAPVLSIQSEKSTKSESK